MKPYPWYSINNFGTARMFGGLFGRITSLLRVLAAVLTLGVSELVRIIMLARYVRVNDAWWKRGLGTVIVAAFLYPLTGGVTRWIHAWTDLAYSLGDKATMTWQEALVGVILGGLPLGLFLCGLAVLLGSYESRFSGEHYLRPTRPVLRTRLRLRRNTKALREGITAADGALKFGVIVDDPIPWRTPRYGMICARPIDRLGHGAILGGSDTGKTVLAMNLLYQFLSLKNGSLYIDYKASRKTYDGVRAAALSAHRPFYSFDLGIGSGERSWYDPLAWQGEASDKASMLAASFNFPDSGDAAYYRHIAEAWLTMQFQIMERIGRLDGESQFDFLLATASVKGMRARIDVLKGGTDADRDYHSNIVATMGTTGDKDLSNLRANLVTVVNAGGARLRPQADVPAISLARAAEEGAVVYIGLSPATNEVALKIIGSLVLRDLGVLAGGRMHAADDPTVKPMLALVDEASRMGNRAVVMENLFTQAREAKIWLWVLTQTFSTWPESTVNDMNANVQTYVAFRIPEETTRNALEGALGTIPALSEMSEGRVEHRAFQGDVSKRSGDSRRSVTTAPFLVAASQKLATVANYHAYVWFTGSHDRATIKVWKPKRPVNKDDIKRDAPLVRIVQTEGIANPPEPEEKAVGFLDATPSVEQMEAWNQSAPGAPAQADGGRAPAAGGSYGIAEPPEDPWADADDGWEQPAASVWDDQPDLQPTRYSPTDRLVAPEEPVAPTAPAVRPAVADAVDWAPFPGTSTVDEEDWAPLPETTPHVPVEDAWAHTSDVEWGEPVAADAPTGAPSTEAQDAGGLPPADKNGTTEEPPVQPAPTVKRKTPESGKGEKRRRWE